MNIQFILNGEDLQVKAEAGDRLSDLLVDLDIVASVHPGCRLGSCGRCMVLLNGDATNSCLVPAFAARNSEIITYEGLIQTPEFEYIEQAFRQHKLELCNFCKPAVSLLIASLLEHSSRPGNEAIEEIISSVSCRCTAPHAIFEATMTAVYLKEGRINPDAR